MNIQMICDLKKSWEGEVNEELGKQLKLKSQTEKTSAKEEGVSPNFRAVTDMIMPDIETHMKKGTRKQKSYYLSYWGTYCAAYKVRVPVFGKITAN